MTKITKLELQQALDKALAENKNLRLRLEAAECQLQSYKHQAKVPTHRRTVWDVVVEDQTIATMFDKEAAFQGFQKFKARGLKAYYRPRII